MTKQHELAELRSLFGRSAVDEAIASCDEAKIWGLQHAFLVAQASTKLQILLHKPLDAVAYAQSLEPQLRAALIVAILDI
jgi:hypothetical protein